METCEDIRHTEGMKELYSHRKTIERIFGTAKENHGFRYTQLYGKARMTMKVALTFACMNLKKLAKCKAGMGITDGIIQGKISCFRNKFHKHKEKCSEKRKFLGALCRKSEGAHSAPYY